VTLPLDEMLERPGIRLPLLTRGEADALVVLLGQLGDDHPLQYVGLELQARLGMRLPAA
jgi:hypothetical protein